MNDILSAWTQLGAISDLWSMWSNENDDKNFYLKCLAKRNWEKGTKYKLQGNKVDFSFDRINNACGHLLSKDKNQLSYKFLKFLTKETNENTYK